MKYEEEWIARLDALKVKYNLSTEVQLSLLVGVGQSMLGHIRSGRKSIPMPTKLRILDKLGYAMTREVILSVLPDESRKVVIEIDNSRLTKKKPKK